LFRFNNSAKKSALCKVKVNWVLILNHKTVNSMLPETDIFIISNH
jgi:hypothetical protein